LTNKRGIHVALCGSIDTPNALDPLDNLISTTDIYINTRVATSSAFFCPFCFFKYFIYVIFNQDFSYQEK
jgi:hypothetical protein